MKARLSHGGPVLSHSPSSGRLQHQIVDRFLLPARPYWVNRNSPVDTSTR